MKLSEIKKFLSVKASFAPLCKACALTVGKKCPWGANSFNLLNKVGRLDENNPFDVHRA